MSARYLNPCLGCRFLGSSDAADRGIELAGLVQLLDVIPAIHVVTVQLGEEEPALLIPANAGRLVDERFTGDQLGAEPGRQTKGFGALDWRQRRRRIRRGLDFSEGADVNNRKTDAERGGNWASRLHPIN